MDPNSSVTATSGASSGQGADQETQMLLTSLREVISNQAREVQMLQKSVKDLTTSNKTKDDEVRSIHRPLAAADLLEGFRLHP